MNPSARLERIEEIRVQLKEDPSKFEDSDLSTEVFDLAFTLLTDLKTGGAAVPENRKAAKAIVKCMPKNSLKLQLLIDNLSKSGVL